jgi:thioredoxin-like negative regulator of GroEL
MDTLIEQNKAILIYFSSTTCGVCKALKPKIKKAFEDNYPNIIQHFLDIKQSQELANSLNIFSVPSVLIFFDGKEFFRKSRNISTSSLIYDIKRPYEIFFDR